MADVEKEITEILQGWSEGNPEALAKLFPLIYDNLKRLARARLRSESEGFTLAPTEVVHEIYFKLIGQNRAEWKNRGQFFKVVSRMMRHFLLDYHRKKSAKKRPPRLKIALDWGSAEVAEARTESWVELIAMNEALEKLAALDSELASYVELRWLAGLELRDLAEMTGLSISTLKNRWRFARAFLRKELGEKEDPEPQDPPGDHGRPAAGMR